MFLTKKMIKNVLLVEDNAANRRLMQEAFKEVSFDGQLDVVENGTEAIQFLNKEQQFKDKSQPDIILLDLNLPGKSGIEVLHQIKADEMLKSIPVVILTGSNSLKDIEVCSGVEGCRYKLKPSGFDELIDFVKSLEDFC